MEAREPITAVADVPTDTTVLFTVRDVDSGEEDEAVLTRVDGEVFGWLNRCSHFRHVRIDKGSGAPERDGELVCTNHGAMFESDTGRCTFGPCEGAFLDEVEVTVADGSVYLADDDYEFVATGGVDAESTDLTSRSNVEF